MLRVRSAQPAMLADHRQRAALVRHHARGPVLGRRTQPRLTTQRRLLAALLSSEAQPISAQLAQPSALALLTA